jgi:hypothetical protein
MNPADRREMLLDRRRAVAARQRLDIGRDMVCADRAKLGDAVHREPVEEAAHGDAIGGARVRVADVRGEEIDEPQRRAVTGGGDHRRHRHPGCRLDDGECCSASQTAARLFAIVHGKSPQLLTTILTVHLLIRAA